MKKLMAADLCLLAAEGYARGNTLYFTDEATFLSSTGAPTRTIS